MNNFIAKTLSKKNVNIKLYSPILGRVILKSVNLKAPYPICVLNERKSMGYFLPDGRYVNSPDAEVMLFPSKIMRDWKIFSWESGDILAGDCSHAKFVRFKDDSYETFLAVDYINYYAGIYIPRINLSVYDFKIEERGREIKNYKEEVRKNNSFKPFDKVLVRNKDNDVWNIDIFSRIDKSSNKPYICIGGRYNQCLHYSKYTYDLIGTNG